MDLVEVVQEVASVEGINLLSLIMFLELLVMASNVTDKLNKTPVIDVEVKLEVAEVAVDLAATMVVVVPSMTLIKVVKDAEA